MKEWWNRRKGRTRRAKKKSEKYTLTDFIVDGLLWLPELIIFPFRLLIWFFRGLVKSILNIFDIL